MHKRVYYNDFLDLIEVYWRKFALMRDAIKKRKIFRVKMKKFFDLLHNERGQSACTVHIQTFQRILESKQILSSE